MSDDGLATLHSSLSVRSEAGPRSRKSHKSHKTSTKSPSSKANGTRTSAKAAEEARERILREEKNRREQADLRALLEQEIEKLKEEQKRIIYNDKYTLELEQQLNSQGKIHVTNIAAIEEDIAKWKLHVKVSEDLAKEADKALENVLGCETQLKNIVRCGKAQLISKFCLSDKCEDIPVLPSEVLTRSRPEMFAQEPQFSQDLVLVQDVSVARALLVERHKYCSDVRRELDLIRLEMTSLGYQTEHMNVGNVRKMQQQEECRFDSFLAPKGSSEAGVICEWAMLGEDGM